MSSDRLRHLARATIWALTAFQLVSYMTATPLYAEEQLNDVIRISANSDAEPCLFRVPRDELFHPDAELEIEFEEHEEFLSESIVNELCAPIVPWETSIDKIMISSAAVRLIVQNRITKYYLSENDLGIAWASSIGVLNAVTTLYDECDSVKPIQWGLPVEILNTCKSNILLPVADESLEILNDIIGKRDPGKDNRMGIWAIEDWKKIRRSIDE